MQKDNNKISRGLWKEMQVYGKGIGNFKVKMENIEFKLPATYPTEHHVLPEKPLISPDIIYCTVMFEMSPSELNF